MISLFNIGLLKYYLVLSHPNWRSIVFRSPHQNWQSMMVAVCMTHGVSIGMVNVAVQAMACGLGHGARLERPQLEQY